MKLKEFELRHSGRRDIPLRRFLNHMYVTTRKTLDIPYESWKRLSESLKKHPYKTLVSGGGFFQARQSTPHISRGIIFPELQVKNGSRTG